MPSLRIVVPLLAAMIGFGIAQATAEDPPPLVDAARQSERHAIEPGTESLFGDMLGKGESLPGGCTLSDGRIERTAVLATYTCGDAKVVLQLVHPESAPSRAVRTERFAIGVQSGAPPAGLVEAVAERMRAREAAFTWTEVGDADAQSATGGSRRRWLLWVAVIAVAAILVLRTRRREPDRTE